MTRGTYASKLHARMREAAIKGQIYAYSKGIISKSKLCLPEFMCIGAIKCGTTWLYENLRLHPEIFLPEEKETYFFDFRYGAYPISWYSKLFAEGGEKLKGDMTPGYSLITRKRIGAIRELIPDAKLIFAMRNPIERAWSDANMVLAVKKNRRITQVPEEDLISYLTSDKCVSRGDYETSIENWLSIYERNQLLILFLDDINKAPESVLRKLTDFLGISFPENLEKYPLREKIVPRYTDNKQVKRGAVMGASDRYLEKIPDRYLELLKRLHTERILRLGDRYGAPVQSWLK